MHADYNTCYIIHEHHHCDEFFIKDTVDANCKMDDYDWGKIGQQSEKI